MIEMSAATLSATALPGAVLAAAPAAAGGEGAQIVDFSSVLASSTAPGTVPMQQPIAAPPADAQPAIPAKAGTSGNPTGKILPTGNLPAERKPDAKDDTAPKENGADHSATLEAAPPPVATPAPLAVAVSMATPPPALIAPETPQGFAARKGAAPSQAGIAAQPVSGMVGMAQQHVVPGDTSSTLATPVSDMPEHKPMQEGIDPAAVTTPVAPSPRQDTLTAPALPTDLRATPTPAGFSAASHSDTALVQDIATLVDRITEARAAAAPHAVRAALMHEDFGAVSLTFRADDSHMHVTLGSADPGFAPAVHAAAATARAGDDATRRDAQSQQSSGQQQDTAMQNDASSQQQPSRERTAANERTARDQAFRQPTGGSGRDQTSSAPQPRRSGIYA